MKKLIQTAGVYGLFALAGGVFYREFTKFQGFDGVTSLAFVHVHLLVLGTILFLLLASFAANTKLTTYKKFNRFLLFYNIALPATTTMMVVRGVTQVLRTPLSKGIDAAISGMAGIAHILMLVAFIFLYQSLMQMAKEHQAKR